MYPMQPLYIIITVILKAGRYTGFSSGGIPTTLPLPLVWLREAAKKVLFSGTATKALSPLPLLVAGPLKKNFFCGFPYIIKL